MVDAAAGPPHIPQSAAEFEKRSLRNDSGNHSGCVAASTLNILQFDSKN